VSEKTEKPTPKKLRQAREKGQVAKSKDLTQTLQIVAVFGYLVAGGASIVSGLTGLIMAPFDVLALPFPAAVNVLASSLLTDATLILLPFIGIVLAMGIFGEGLQVGVLLAFKALIPSMDKLNPLTNFKNMFSKKNLVEFLKSLFKIVFLSALIYLLLRDALPALVDIPLAGLPGVGLAVAELLKIMIFNVGLAYLAISLADFAWQRFQHTKQLMMSKDEVKQEYKEMEGDPHIKNQRKHLHQEMLQQGAVAKTRKASVLITNPTHLAIALFYDKDETPLPVLLAKGEGALAEQMVKAAREAGVPVMQNIPLARALFAQGTEEQYIPSDLIEPVAEVLRLVQKLAAGDAPPDHDHV
jgi:type III secretion protein U